MKPVQILAKATYDYVPFEDRDLPVAEQTVFELKTLTPADDYIMDNLTGTVKDGGMNLRIGDQNEAALNLGLIGVRNFKDGKTEIHVSRNELVTIHGRVHPLNEVFLARLPKEIRQELATQIQLGKELDEEDAKN